MTGLAFGLAPVLRLSGEADLSGLREGSRSGGGRKEGARSALVVVEIVASIVLACLRRPADAARCSLCRPSPRDSAPTAC